MANNLSHYYCQLINYNANLLFLSKKKKKQQAEHEKIKLTAKILINKRSKHLLEALIALEWQF